MIRIILLILIAVIFIFFIKGTNTNSYISPRNLFDSEVAEIRKEIYNMQHRDFEIFTAKLLALTGNYKYTVTPPVNDGGKDVILKKNNQIIYLECKHFKDNSKAGRPDAQKLCGAMVADNVNEGILVTLNGVNKNCIDYCEQLKKSKVATISIDIINLDDLINECLKLNAHTVYELVGIPDKYINIK